MNARKPAARKAAVKPTSAPAAAEQAPTPSVVDEQSAPATEVAPAVDEQPAEVAPPELGEDQAPELAWCRIGRDLEADAPECPRHEFEAGTRLCNLHFVTRLDLREVARND